MKRLIFIIALLTAGRIYAQTNVVLLNQLVSESESEHSRQADARTKQAAVSANEQVNNAQMGRLKTTYRDIHNRFSLLGAGLTTITIGTEAIPVINNIVSLQQQIISLSQKSPVLIPLALNSEANIADQANLLMNYMFGLFVTFGDINQMKASDRKMLFGYVVTELRRIEGASRGLLNSMNNFLNSITRRSLNPFFGFINQDKALIDDIMRNASALKK